ncbi:hypothetical protein A9Z06_01925 [Rhizobium sp. YK2]|nr:hypothetical protein A9Z06_01925 [Rhizobium sp. YK2]
MKQSHERYHFRLSGEIGGSSVRPANTSRPSDLVELYGSFAVRFISKERLHHDRQRNKVRRSEHSFRESDIGQSRSDPAIE